MPFSPKERKEIANGFALSMGRALGQEYRLDNGQWWLYSLGKPARVLQADEIAWHIARNHAPFVAGGITPDNPHWFDDPR